MQNKRLANYLQESRDKRGMTQSELAVEAGMSVETIRNIEQARGRHKPSVEILQALANHVGDYKTFCYLSGRLTPEMEKRARS